MSTDIADGVIEAIKVIVNVVLWNFILFNIGRLVLLLFTAGRYPRGRALGMHPNRISCVGLVVILCAWIGFFVTNNFISLPMS